MSTSSRRLVVASGSPRRSLLLATAGFEFDVDPPDITETQDADESPMEMVQRLALEKANKVAARNDPDACVLGVDTVVVLDDAVLGKPADEADAVETLLRLADNTHTVYSGYAAVVRSQRLAEVGVASSLVVMRPIDRTEAEAYAATGEPLDRAGSYAIQGRAKDFIVEIAGTRSNVMGLPLADVVKVLGKLGVTSQR